MPQAPDENRRRAALILALIGVGLILAGSILAIQRPDPSATAPGASSPSPEQSRQIVEAIRQVAFLLMLLVLIFAVSVLAFRRWSRHFRRRLLRKPRHPTPASDVWAMHRLPDAPAPDEPS